MRIVLDTNVLVSAVLFGGKPREVLLLGMRGKVVIALSQDILKEFAGVLVNKRFKMPVPYVQQVVHELSEIAQIVIVNRKLNIIKNDPDDDRILECALCAKATYIVSGDLDLLTLGVYRNIKLLTPAQFLDQFYQ